MRGECTFGVAMVITTGWLFDVTVGNVSVLLHDYPTRQQPETRSI